MLFSVLIPLYNCEKYIGECIKSVLCQDMEDFELIIINDGSEDKSGLIADCFAKEDKRIKVIHQRNQGIFHTRCVAVEEAVGDYIIFIDADDKIKNNALSRLKEELIYADLDIILFKWERFNVSGKVKKSNNKFEHNSIFESSSKSILFEEILKGSSLNSMCVKAIKRDCFNIHEIINFPKITMGDDLVHTLRPLTNSKRIKYIDEALYKYRIHNSSISSVFNPNIYKNNRFIVELLNKYLVEWSMDSDYYKKMLYIRHLKSTASFALLSKSNIKGKEDEYKKTIEEIKNDNLFKDAYKYKNDLPIIYKLAIYMVNNFNYKALKTIKPIITKVKMLLF
ncbi:glycosyltransferase family 2 protein [Peribacillus frigoritolerans]|uniref:glycosyltransferase family 2 protein n=1 Tax=Peribacillus frigoritolerans TaxID=450367 RepID=UPI0020C14D13|nr:glycosyltransferase [Peribacillus frigoritolerans]